LPWQSAAGCCAHPARRAILTARAEELRGLTDKLRLHASITALHCRGAEAAFAVLATELEGALRSSVKAVPTTVIEAGALPTRTSLYALTALSPRREVLPAELGAGAVAALGCPRHPGDRCQDRPHQRTTQQPQCLAPRDAACKESSVITSVLARASCEGAAT
jgi:hypothetical protein